MREEFCFPEAVVTCFRFLVEDFGFVVVKQDPTLVRFESRDVFVNLFHGRGSYELGVEMGERISEESREFGFTLREIISVTDTEKGSAYRPPQITEPELITKHVSAISELVKQFAPLALVGDKDFFKRASDLQVKKSDEYLKTLELKRVRSEVDVAWRDKNYDQVLELYEAVKDDLTPSELKKLEYAKRKLGDTKR